MPAYMIFNESGVADRVGTAAYPPPEAVVIDLPVDRDALGAMMLVPRPTLPPISESGGAWTVSGLPAGTVLEVGDVSGTESMHLEEIAEDGALREFSFPDPGTYEISVIPPLPWMPLIQRVTVE